MKIIVYVLILFTAVFSVVDSAYLPVHAQEAKQKTKYTCPMHPNYISDKPGDCPICHMRLVPLESEEPAAAEVSKTSGGHEHGMPEGYSTVKIRPEQQQLIGIQTAPVKREKLTKEIRAVGQVAYDPDLYELQLEYLRTSRTYRYSRKELLPYKLDDSAKMKDNLRLRLATMGISEDYVRDMDQLEKNISVADKRLIYLSESEDAWIYIFVYEQDIRFVNKKSHFKFEASSYPGREFHGMVEYMDTRIDPMTRTIRVRGLASNPEHLLTPGMYVDVVLETTSDEALLVPKLAVFFTGQKNIVFVDKGDDIFEPREVKLGTETEISYQVLDGLHEGENVVTNGNFLIDSESRLKTASKAAAGAHSGHQGHGG